MPLCEAKGCKQGATDHVRAEGAYGLVCSECCHALKTDGTFKGWAKRKQEENANVEPDEDSGTKSAVSDNVPAADKPVS